jgi:hypothetical protein
MPTSKHAAASPSVWPPVMAVSDCVTERRVHGIGKTRSSATWFPGRPATMRSRASCRSSDHRASPGTVKWAVTCTGTWRSTRRRPDFWQEASLLWLALLRCSPTSRAGNVLGQNWRLGLKVQARNGPCGSVTFAAPPQSEDIEERAVIMPGDRDGLAKRSSGTTATITGFLRSLPSERAARSRVAERR